MDTLDEAREIIDGIDREMAELFEKRMTAVGKIAGYKKQNGLDILCRDRENEIVLKNSELISDGTIKKYYADFISGVIELSKKYQKDLIDEK